MNIKTCLTALALIFCLTAKAQNVTTFPYVESFENGLNGWTVVDLDGNNDNWFVFDFSQFPPIMAELLGYIAYDGTHTLYSEPTNESIASDWAISPVLELPTIDSLYLSWYVKCLNTDGIGEPYDVRISLVTDSEIDTSNFNTVLFSEATASTSYLYHSVDLTEYMGQNVRIAFHHYKNNNNPSTSIWLDYIFIGNDSLPMAQINGPEDIDANDITNYTAQVVSGSTDGLTYYWFCDDADIVDPFADTVQIIWYASGIYQLGLEVTNTYGSYTAWKTVVVGDCAVIDDFPFTETFDTLSTTRACWSMIDADEGGEAWVFNDSCATSSSISFFGMFPDQDNWLISPKIALDDNYYVLTWQVRPKDSILTAEHYGVYISTGSNPYDMSQYVEVFSETLQETGNWQQRILSLGAYGGETFRIAFRHYGTADQDHLLLTNVTVDFAGAPMVTLNAPATAIVDDSTRFDITIFSVSPISDITWRVQTDTFDSYDVISTTDPFAYVWPVGTPDGNYWVYVDVTNDQGTATDSAIVYLHTCEVIDVLPYLHVFGTDDDCWRIGSGWYTYGYFAEIDGISTPAAISFSHDEFGEDLHADNSIASPYIHIPDNTYELRYVVGEVTSPFGGYNCDKYSLIIHTDNTSDTILTTLVGTGDPQKQRFNLGNYANQTIQIEFRHFDSPSGYALALANVEVYIVTAPEITIVAPSRARNIDSVNISAQVVSSENLTYLWTLNGATPASDTTLNITAQWDNAGIYSIVFTAFSPLFGPVSDSVSIEIVECTGVAEIPYTEHFDLDMGCWISHDLDGDGYGWGMSVGTNPADLLFANALPYGNQGNSVISWSTYPSGGLLAYVFSGEGVALNTNNLLLSPAFSLTDSTEWKLSFHVASAATLINTLFGPEENYDAFEVLLTTNTAQNTLDLSNFTVLMPLTVANYAGYQQYTIDLSSYAGQTVQIAFRHLSDGHLALLLDEISLYVATDPIVEPCDIPTGLTAGDVTDESIAFFWNTNSNVINWNIQYGPQGGPLTSATTNNNSYTITGLTPNTSYQVQVQANCGDGNLSEWTNPITVTTTTGIVNHLSNSIVLYPNPAKEYVNVECRMMNDNNNISDIQLFDVYGKLVRTVHGTTRINISDLADGMYFVRTITDAGVVTKRFVKK